MRKKLREMEEVYELKRKIGLSRNVTLKWVYTFGNCAIIFKNTCQILEIANAALKL